MTEVERNLDKELRNARHERNKNETDSDYRWVIKGYSLKRVRIDQPRPNIVTKPKF